MTIKNKTITVNGLTKKIKEDGYFGEYTFKLQKTQVKIRTVKEFKKSLETKWVKDMFINTWNNKYNK